MTEPIPYLSLDPRVEEAIRADRAAGWKNPCAFDDAQVTRREPNPHDEATLARPAFAARHREDPQRAGLQPLRRQDAGVLVRGE